MKSIAYIFVGLLFFYIAYDYYTKRVFGKLCTAIDSFLVSLLMISISFSNSNQDFVFFFVVAVLFLLFEMVDRYILKKHRLESCIHRHTKIYYPITGAFFVSILCFFITRVF